MFRLLPPMLDSLVSLDLATFLLKSTKSIVSKLVWLLAKARCHDRSSGHGVMYIFLEIHLQEGGGKVLTNIFSLAQV